VGLGQSRQKYSWIPEAHNDFIFAIIGEELGLVGTFVVLVLFAILGTAIYRVVVAQKAMFHRVLAGTIMVWLLGQATVNMAVVTGLAPVVGIPLPFISYGGSALLMSLCAIGVVLSLARAQMAPGLQPKRLFRFGPAGLAASLRKRGAARGATGNDAKAAGGRTGKNPARTTAPAAGGPVPKRATDRKNAPTTAAPGSPGRPVPGPAAPSASGTRRPAPSNPARKRK
jgi:cell division protein FtsW